jgi:hypothetical protein
MVQPRIAFSAASIGSELARNEKETARALKRRAFLFESDASDALGD